MLTGKEKKFLRAMGNDLDAVVQVGKSGVNESVLFSFNEALEARELVKVKVLKNCESEIDDVAVALVQGGRGEVVQAIGRNILYYRPHPTKPKIVLPK